MSIMVSALVVLVAGLAAGAQDVIEVELVIETFDGCNCDPLNPPACPACHDLDGNGCNVHNGISNDPHPGCPFGGAVPWPHPNYDFFGPQSIDQDWVNIGGARDYAGDFTIKNGTEPENQASQRFELQSGRYIKPAWPWEGAGLGYIDPHDPQDIVGDIFGRMHIEEIRATYNAAHPDAPLPAPLPDEPAYIAIDIRRVGDGFTDAGAPELVLNPSIWPPTYNPAPEDLTGVYHNDLPVPNDAAWHTYRIVDFNKYPQDIYVGLYFDFKIPDGQGGYQAGTTDEPVQVWIDNLRVVYNATPPNEDCDNAWDDDGDGLTDCEDPDCYDDPACPCNEVFVFDVDSDGDVDQDDFAFLQTCITGPNPQNAWGTLSVACQCLDVTGPGQPDPQRDQAIDQQDYNAFEACASGPMVPYDDTCDDDLPED